MEVTYHNSPTMTYHFKNEHGQASLTLLPGSATVGLSHSFFINPRATNKGYGTAHHAERIAWARDNNTDYLICIVNANNAAEIAILKKFGWKELDKFFNQCTCENNILFGKNLWSRE